MNIVAEYTDLYRALDELVQAIDTCLDGVTYTKDIEPYKAEVVWTEALRNARIALENKS